MSLRARRRDGVRNFFASEVAPGWMDTERRPGVRSFLGSSFRPAPDLRSALDARFSSKTRDESI
eukprot:scaffold565_cov379-Pinguiococcus_pyrenoidosus.AAC.12